MIRILRASMEPCDECAAGYAEEHLTTCSQHYRLVIPPCGCPDQQELASGEYVPLHRPGCRGRLALLTHEEKP